MSLDTLLTSLRTASLLPSPLIPADFAPSYTLSVSFGGFAPQNGELARVGQVKDEPRVTFERIAGEEKEAGGDGEESFTFCMLDPDAPTPADPKFAFWRHWVVASIPSPTSSSSSSSSESEVSAGRTLTPYLAPGPKDESGPHRYLFLLFREPRGESGLEQEDVGGDEFVDRRSFGAEEIVRRKGLVLVGVQWMRGVGDGWVAGKEEL
jgi:hypothetical protein